jgi:glycolate oxidase FAD binding subunit
VTTQDVVEAIQAARESEHALRVRGAGTWLSAGRPVDAAASLSLASDTGIVEYVPGDLTLTARAGTRLSELSAATHEHGQWLPLDPWGGDAGTLGATISTATAGPYAHAMGLPRDIVLGLELVNGEGSVIRSGGRVVKNVAGFDLTRLVTGAWGTLGVITEATVRLRARPEQTRTVSVSTVSTRAELNELAKAIRALPFTPLACEVIGPRFAAHLDYARQSTLLLRLGGNARSVAAQLDALRALGELRDADEGVWAALRGADASAVASWRWSAVPATFGETWTAAESATRQIDAAWLHGSPARGVVRAIVTRPAPPAAIARGAAGFRGTVSIERLPPESWAMLPAATPPHPLPGVIRGKFDPGRILNPGIMGELA